MTYRYIYKITCTAGSFKGKFYYGQHTTENLDDGYKGSGRKIVNYNKKHPDDFIKEIISFHNSQEELNQAEYEIIKPWLGNPMCLNLQGGGSHKEMTDEYRKLLSEGHKRSSDEVKNRMKEVSKNNITKYNYSEAHHINVINSNKNRWMNGCPVETRKKMSESLKGKAVGKIWMRNEEETIMIYPEDYEYYISKGYIKGRGSNCPWNINRRGKYKPWNKGVKLLWVTLDNKHKQIKEEELQKYIDAGWHRGRK